MMHIIIIILCALHAHIESISIVDEFKYRYKLNETFLNEAEKELVPHLNALADSFSEIGKRTS